MILPNQNITDQKLKIKAVGDICPGDVSILGLGVCSMTKKRGSHFIFEHVAEFLNDSDLLIGNLEGALSQQMENIKVPNLRFCGIPGFAKELKEIGFNVINVANNHVLDNGIEIFEETVGLIQNEGINVCGLKGKNGFHSEPVILDKSGIKIGVLAYNWIAKDKFVETDKYIAQSHDSVVNYTWDRDDSLDLQNQNNFKNKNQNVINDIKTLKEIVDYVIVYPHWAYEYVHYPPYGVTLEAKTFIDAGADTIIGVHPHVLQGHEEYLNKNIFYSLGNFVFDAKSELTRNSLILNLTVNQRLATEFLFQFVRINNSCQPIPLSNPDPLEKIIQNSNVEINASDKKNSLNDTKVYKEFEKLYNRGKLKRVFLHFKAIFIYPPVIFLIIKKMITFLGLILLRFKGQKVRW